MEPCDDQSVHICSATINFPTEFVRELYCMQSIKRFHPPGVVLLLCASDAFKVLATWGYVATKRFQLRPPACAYPWSHLTFTPYYCGVLGICNGPSGRDGRKRTGLLPGYILKLSSLEYVRVIQQRRFLDS